MLLWLAGCVPNDPSFVEPFDGQTNVAPDDPLLVHLPERYPNEELLPDDLVTVVDLESGGLVEGLAIYEDFVVVFEPDEPWRVGGRYGWAVSQPLGEARRPQLTVPPSLVGEASFAVGVEPVLLDATLFQGELCLFFSGPVRDGDGSGGAALHQLEVAGLVRSDVPTTAREVALSDTLLSDDDGPREVARCVPSIDLDEVGPDTLARYTSPSGTTSAAPVRTAKIDRRVAIRHRFAEPE